MNWAIFQVYKLILKLIRICKNLEFQILKIFLPLLRKKGDEILDSIGIVVLCAENSETKTTEKDGKLLNCDNNQHVVPKYDKIIRVKVYKEEWYARIANEGIMALGETYMDGMWNYIDDVDDISEFTKRVLENNIQHLYDHKWNNFLEWLELYAFNLQTVERSFQVGQSHYDLGNDLFEKMLDPWMQYTCGYWKDTDNLNDAQVAKMDLIARKLDLAPGMRVLDIGCGWGTLCKYLAKHYQVECVGLTIGEEGAKYGRKVCAGLPVDIRVQDYRQIEEKFDRIVANRCLEDDGIFVLHTIGRNHLNFKRSVRWYDKYIFPNGNLPDPMDIVLATNGLFVIEDWHNFGLDYAKTLYAWRENFIKSWPEIRDKYEGVKFYRMWIFYLSVSRGFFLSRRGQLYQLVLSKDGLKRDYRAPR